MDAPSMPPQEDARRRCLPLDAWAWVADGQASQRRRSDASMAGIGQQGLIAAKSREEIDMPLPHGRRRRRAAQSINSRANAAGAVSMSHARRNCTEDFSRRHTAIYYDGSISPLDRPTFIGRWQCPNYDVVEKLIRVHDARIDMQSDKSVNSC